MASIFSSASLTDIANAIVAIHNPYNTKTAAAANAKSTYDTKRAALVTQMTKNNPTSPNIVAAYNELIDAWKAWIVAQTAADTVTIAYNSMTTGMLAMAALDACEQIP
jgi:hypothetical protein